MDDRSPHVMRCATEDRIRSAWLGRVSGCILGKPVELVSILQGRSALRSYLESQNAWPVRDYIPGAEDPLVRLAGRGCVRGKICRAEPDDDINYTVLSLIMLEEFGGDLSTKDVAVTWLRRLPAGATFTAERAAYRALLCITEDSAVMGLPHDLDLGPCAQNPYSEWIGAQIRADMYGWVSPGKPAQAAGLARRDARLSHTGEGVNAAAFVAALASLIPATDSLEAAIPGALNEVPQDSEVQDAVELALSLAEKNEGPEAIHERYKNLSPVHAVNNLALVVWALARGFDDFSQAIGDVVSAGLDTDCNGATVGGLWGITGRPIPEHWTRPWQGRVAVSLSGLAEMNIEDLVQRTVNISARLNHAVRD